MKSDQIRAGVRYVIRYGGKQIRVKAVSRCLSALDSWICQGDGKVSLIIPTESFLRPADRVK